MNLNSLFATGLKEERNRLGFILAEIAKKCDVSREIWGKYERRLAMAGGEVLFSLVAIRVDMGYLFSGERAKTDLTPSEQTLLED